MMWMLASAAIAAGGVLYQLGAMSVWVAVLSLTLRAMGLAFVLAMAATIGRVLWHRIGRHHSGKAIE